MDYRAAGNHKKKAISPSIRYSRRLYVAYCMCRNKKNPLYNAINSSKNFIRIRNIHMYVQYDNTPGSKGRDRKKMKKFTFKFVQERGVRLLWNIIIFVDTPVEYIYTSYTMSSVSNSTYCFIYTISDYARVASSALNHPSGDGMPKIFRI